MTEIEQEVKGMEPPAFATQGEAAGKTRGRPKAKATPKRKPREKATPKAKAKAKAKTSKVSKSKTAKTESKRGGKPKAKSAPKSKARTRSAGSATPDAAAAPEKARRAAPSKASKRPAEPDAAPCPEPDVVEEKPSRKSRTRKYLPAHAANAEPRVPPSHVTHNHIYSSAYRKALTQYPGDKEKARQIGKEAVDFFKSTGTVNSLCGEFRSSPRAPSVAAPQTEDGNA